MLIVTVCCIPTHKYGYVSRSHLPKIFNTSDFSSQKEMDMDVELFKCLDVLHKDMVFLLLKSSLSSHL